MISKTITSILIALAVAAYAQAAAAEPVCTGQLSTHFMDYTGEPTSVARVNARPIATLPEGTPTCVFIGFHREHRPATEVVRLQVMAAALRYVCTTQWQQAMQSRYMVNGVCTLDDGTVIPWRAQPRPPEQR